MPFISVVNNDSLEVIFEGNVDTVPRNGEGVVTKDGVLGEVITVRHNLTKNTTKIFVDLNW